MQGDTVTLHLPPVGVDPDGDGVNIVSIGDAQHGAPRLGRITQLTPSGITYQAFPGVQGTDQFSYVVEDTYGKQATGVARVGVVPPGPPQPPVALDDLVTADSGRTVEVDVLQNDLRTPGTRLTVEPLQGAPAGVTLDAKTGLITVKARTGNNDVVEVPYSATNGIDSSKAVLRVRTQKGFDNPPVAEDVLAKVAPDSKSVTVDVLATAYDIDDALQDLKVDLPEMPTGAKSLGHGKFKLPVTDVEQVLPYTVTDPEQAIAVAVIRVPARPTDTPYLKSDAQIKMKPGETVTKKLSDLVGDPEGDPVVFTTLDADALYGAPEGALRVSATKDSLKLTAGKTPGPASVTFTVSDRAKLGDPKAHVVTLSVPVQIGTERPEVTCPSEPLTVAEGGRDLVIDVYSVCHVWTSTPADARTLSYKGSWIKQPAGISMDNTDGRIRLRTGTDAKVGQRGQIAISADGGSTTACVKAGTCVLNVLVTKLPPPSLAAVNVDGHAGKPVAVDLKKYLQTSVAADALDVQITNVTPVGSPPAKASHKGSVLTVTPHADTSGVMKFRVEVSDLGKKSTRPRAVGMVAVAVAARPGAPTGLTAGQDIVLSNTVVLSWGASDPHGAPLQGYKVHFSGGTSGDYPCSGSPCRVTGLTNGKKYTFTVTAKNAEGESKPGNSTSAEPDAKSGPVQNLAVKLQRDRSVTLTWAAPAKGNYSAAKSYRVVWPGGGQNVTGSSVVANGLTNGRDVTFTVIPINDFGDGEPNTVQGMGAGKPGSPAKPTFALADRPGNVKAVTVNWGAVDANGPSPVTYQVKRNGTVICSWITATSCQDDLAKDGSVSSYTVQARNAEEASPRESGSPGNHLSAVSAQGTVEAASTPDAVSISNYKATGVNQQVQVSFSTGASHGKTNRVECTVNGATCAGSPWTYPTSGGGGTKTLNTSVSNGSNANIKIRACNGSSGSSQTGAECSAWASADATPFGPIGNVSISVSASGDPHQRHGVLERKRQERAMSRSPGDKATRRSGPAHAAAARHSIE